MKKAITITVLSVLSLLTVGCAGNSPLQAKMSNATDNEGVTIIHPRVRETPPSASMTAAYMQIKNDNDYPVDIFAGSSNKHAVLELHNVVMDGEMHRMVKQEKIRIAPHSIFTMQPGGYHVMLINPTSVSNLRAGKDSVDITLFIKNPNTQMIYKEQLSAPVVMVGNETMKIKHMHH